MKFPGHFTFFLVLIGFVCCQLNDLDTDDLEKKISEIPGLESFNTSKLPSEEDVEKIVREKCEKNGGGEEAFNALKNQQSSLKGCLEQYLNATQIQLEVEESKKTGSMDEVFGKYCKKYPDIYQCAESVTDAVKPCLDSNEQNALNIALNVTNELRDFICYKDGDRIAMFIAEGGIECMESRKEALQECANKTIGARIPTELSVNTLPSFLFSDRDCSDFDLIRKCFNTELEKCKDSTPANIVDAFFKFLKKNTPCQGRTGTVKEGGKTVNEAGKTVEEAGGGGASNVITSAFTVLISLALSRFF